MTQTKTRRAPTGMTLDVPLYVQVFGALLGLGTMSIGVLYLVTPPPRSGPSAATSVIAILEPILGWVMLAIGLFVIAATAARKARASAHVLAAAVHLTYMAGLFIQWVITEPVRPTVTSVLSAMAAVAHGGALLDYWKRGYR